MKWLTQRRPARKPALPDDVRIYAIGDVHGRADLLNATFQKIDADRARDEPAQVLTVLVGDYVDRGLDSRRVLDLLIDRRRTHETVCLRGNHEDILLSVLDDPAAIDAWSSVGGLQTLASYGLSLSPRMSGAEKQQVAAEFALVLPPAQREFLHALPYTFECGDFFFVHAGVRPGTPFHEQRQQDLIWIRDEFLNFKGDFGKVVVHGHTPVVEPDFRHNRINIDTGAFATGRLTCLVLQEDRIRLL